MDDGGEMIHAMNIRRAALIAILVIMWLAGAHTSAQPSSDDVPRELEWAVPDSSWSQPDSASVHPDSVWKDTEAAWRELEQMNPNDIDFSEVLGQYSRGWFPRAHTASSLSMFGEMFYADVHDRGNDIRSRWLVPTTAAYTWHNPFESDEREILEAHSDEEAEDGYPVTDYTEYGIGYSYNLPMPLVARIGASLQLTEGVVFAHDTSRSFLTISGAKRPLKEVGVVHVKQYRLNASGGFNIPVYGVFIDSEFGTLASYYYLYVGGSASYAIAHRTTQYQQIASPKSELRYGNGADTVTLISRQRIAGLNPVRTAIDLAIGWHASAEFVAFSFEAFVSIPQTDVFDDTPWRQYYAGFRLSLGYQWTSHD